MLAPNPVETPIHHLPGTPVAQMREYPGGDGKYHIEYGGKHLDLTQPTDGNPQVYSHIENIGEVQTPGATTTAYVRAAQVMQSWADRLDKPVTYGLATPRETVKDDETTPSKSKMVDWAQKHGPRIFKWADWTEGPDDGPEYTATATFRPQSKD